MEYIKAMEVCQIYNSPKLELVCEFVDIDIFGLVLDYNSMNEETQKRDRSPNFPKMPLESALELTKRLYAKIGKTQVKLEPALEVLGYRGPNGAALTTLGALNQYGLVNREGTLAVSPLAIKIIHPLNLSQLSESLKEAALRPKVFAELYSGGFHHSSEDVICNTLIQSNFTPDGARRAANVFKANFDFAKLSDSSLILSGEESELAAADAQPEVVEVKPIKTPISSPSTLNPETQLDSILAKYSIPLGANEATLIFKGESLAPEDFDDLAEYVMMFKKQLERKLRADHIKALITGPSANE